MKKWWISPTCRRCHGQKRCFTVAGDTFGGQPAPAHLQDDVLGSELKDWTRIKALPGASNSFTSADGHCQVKFLEHHEMGYGFTSIKRHGFILTRRWAEKGIPSVAQVQCARLPGSRHLFMVLRVKEEAFGTSGSYSRTVG